MTSTNLMPILTFAVLGLYFTIFFTFVNAHSGCVRLPRSCRVSWNIMTNFTTNVTIRQDKVQQINATLKAVAEANVEEECSSAIRSLVCISATIGCNNTNSSISSDKSQACMMVQRNCTELVAKTYGSMYCSQILGYNDSQCVEVTVAKRGYCPNKDTYKV